MSRLSLDAPLGSAGVTTALIRHIERTCPRGKLYTSTNESNVAMQRLCETLGFKRSGYSENLDEEDPEIIYFKRLAKIEETELIDL